MAAWFDLSKRLDAGLGADDRLHVLATYHGSTLPAWLNGPWAKAIAAAANQAPVVVLNVKGTRLDDTICLVRLADLERLIAEAREPHGSAGSAETP